MDYFYLTIIIVLFLLAISGLIVGVSNDAVNFLNSAIGAKAAPFKMVMVIAAAGVLLGATFSNGMMEVAKKGLFYPESFTFDQVIIIFVTVMITNVLLLDVFNTFGLPTSSTVSLVFALLGGAVGIALTKLSSPEYTLSDLNKFINAGGSLVIISGILFSVAIAFTVGLVVQYITRIIFSFNYKRTIRYFGSLWGGMAITAITYFILIKGAKGSALLDSDKIEWINQHSMLILSLNFIAWVIIIQLVQWIFRINIFIVVVLFGTFALAMAFAGNDLVNFIGVPIAGFEAFKIFISSEAASPDSLTMEGLRNTVPANSIFLVLSGIIMVVTLWFSKKARTVLKTQLNLSKQDDVNERFASSVFSRVLVRHWIRLGNFIGLRIPKKITKFIDSRFDDRAFRKKTKKDKEISFDMVRAAVNLTVASSLIALATSFKLPLSTTYVTFMTAMGTSLADRAWGRESAVYRISGVLVIIGGWFFTALSAFTAAFLISIFIHWGGEYVIAALVLLTVFLAYRNHRIHKKREDEDKKSEYNILDFSKMKDNTVFEQCNITILSSLVAVNDLYKNIIDSFINEKRKKLGKTIKEIYKFDMDIKLCKKNVHQIVQKISIEESGQTGDYYVQIMDYLRETSHCLTFLSQPVYEHIDNNHTPLDEEEKEDLKAFQKKFTGFVQLAIKIISGKEFYDMNKLIQQMQELMALLNKMRRDHLKRVKSKSMSTRLSMLYTDILFESKNMVLYILNLAKTSRDFAEFSKGFKGYIYS
jgi:phosphate/sulfate permease